jgi:RNA polymerase-binding transcription factor DksA
MQIYKLAMQRSILALLVDSLKVSHDLDFPEGPRTIDRMSIHEIEALTCYRNNPRIEALRGALSRLRNGRFGICPVCRNRIEWSLLFRDPAIQECPVCSGHESRTAGRSSRIRMSLPVEPVNMSNELSAP